MKLSILIPTLPGRRILLDRLISVINSQMVKDVEVLTNDTLPTMTMPKKRYLLLLQSLGEYIVFVDDDDMIADDYIERILKAIEQSPDAVGWNAHCYHDRKFDKKEIMSNRFTEWSTKPDHYERTIYNKAPIKREIALQADFTDTHELHEDVRYAVSVKPLIKSEVFIDGPPMYFYCFRSWISVCGNPDNVHKLITEDMI